MDLAHIKEDAAFLLAAAHAAGQAAMAYYRSGNATLATVTYKEGNSPVSEADMAANEMLARMLRPSRPNYGWISEENIDSKDRLDCETLFVVDPIDGTRAFIAGKAEWCVSAAIVHRSEPVVGVIFCPVLGLTYQAAKGLGATLNGKTIRCSTRESPTDVVCAGPKSVVETLQSHFPGLQATSHVPSLAYKLAMAAAGSVDMAIASTGSHDWDIAAADILLREAGAVLLDLDGHPLAYNRPSLKRGVLCAGPEPLARRAVRVLSSPALAQ